MVSIVKLPPIAGWFIREHPTIKWMIWGYPYFRKPADRDLGKFGHDLAVLPNLVEILDMPTHKGEYSYHSKLPLPM